MRTGTDEPDALVRVVIVDDEPLARDAVRLALERAGGVQVVAECGTGDEAVNAIVAQRPDLVFLDVQMPGEDGFDVIARVGSERMPPVVFVTAYDDYALRAFEVHALDYVLKPFDDAKIDAVMAHATQRLARERDSETGRALAALLRDLDTGEARSGGYANRMMVEDDERIRFVPVSAILFLEGDRNYVRVHERDTVHRVRATLADLHRRLDPAHFVRIHRSTVVNLNYIREVQPWFGGDYIALLTDGRQLRVSRRYRDQLLRRTS